jgi:hypothetical protein
MTGFFGWGISFSEGYSEKLNFDPPIGISSGLAVIVSFIYESFIIASLTSTIPFSYVI